MEVGVESTTLMTKVYQFQWQDHAYYAVDNVSAHKTCAPSIPTDTEMILLINNDNLSD